MSGIISDLAHYVDQEITFGTEGLFEETPGGVNLGIIARREKVLHRMIDFAAELSKITAKLNECVTRGRAIHERELSEVNDLLNEINRDDKWVLIKKKSTPYSRVGASYASACAKPVVIPKPIGVSAATYSKVKITEALSISAINVPTFDYVKQDGELYYVNSADHFAFKIAGQMFHGNIGTIYSDEKNPEKIKECKFGSTCIKRDKCDYYHDPTQFSGSKDRRNFIASSWLYAPPNRAVRGRSRRFGSREHLDVDICSVQDDEIARARDQVMHDLLCSVLVAQAGQP